MPVLFKNGRKIYIEPEKKLTEVKGEEETGVEEPEGEEETEDGRTKKKIKV
jgi:hypothetical protein